MRSNNFNQALAYVLKKEGGYSNDQNDHGGATNFGITLADLSAWRKHPCTADDVKNMPLSEAGDIYYAQYWQPLNLDLVMNLGISTAIFDQGVNRGTKTSAKLAQTILQVEVDGNIGDKTTYALNTVNPKIFINAFAFGTLKAYLGIVKHNPSQMVFIDGWVNRAWDLLSLI